MASGCRWRRSAPTCRGSVAIVRLAPGVTAGRRRRADARASTAGWRRSGPTASRSRASRRDCATTWTSRSPAARCAPACSLLLGAVGLPAADRLRQRRQPAARARRVPGPRDRGADVDRRRPPAPAAPAPHRERAAVGGRRRARRAVRLRRGPGDRRADAGVLRPQRIAGDHQPAGPRLLAGRLGHHRHRRRTGAGAAGVEDRYRPGADRQPQHRRRRARRPHPQRAGGRRSGAVGGAAGLRQPDRPHLRGAAERSTPACRPIACC